VVPPLEFIPVAERSGQIIPIGYWVLAETCRTMMEWDRLGLPSTKVAINLSPSQLRERDLVERMRVAVDAHGISPARIMFEITESVAMQDAEKTAATIREFHTHGFEIAIDDFGTGYSSLAYLQQFRVKQLKIDRFFTHGLDKHGDEAYAIVSAIIALAHSLNMDVVAEGVETQSQLDKLNSLLCDQVQGFLLARPLSADDFATLLSGHTEALEEV
jgi:EAL domain-containing protein (putative c-di-GMP-specific phosphodiesterase class I)